MIEIWDIQTGSKLFQFDASKDDHFITCMLLDDSCRRYQHYHYCCRNNHNCQFICRLFTGGSEGSICMWNYNNGELLKTLSPGFNLSSKSVDSKSYFNK